MNPRPDPNPAHSGKPSSPGIHANGKARGPTPAELLARMPRRPLTPEQQAAALEKVQQQATQRVKLGQQLFEAAEARLKQHQDLLKEIQDQQQVLRDKVQEDVAKSLQAYDQWMGQIDESFTKAIKDLNLRIDTLETRFDCARHEMEGMISKAAALLEQTQGLLAEAFDEDTADQVTQAMQASVPEDPHCDIEALENLVVPSVGDADTSPDATEVIEVEIIEASDDTAGSESVPMEMDATREADDVFGEVLRRLRSQGDEDRDAAA